MYLKMIYKYSLLFTLWPIFCSRSSLNQLDFLSDKKQEYMCSNIQTGSKGLNRDNDPKIKSFIVYKIEGEIFKKYVTLDNVFEEKYDKIQIKTAKEIKDIFNKCINQKSEKYKLEEKTPTKMEVVNLNININDEKELDITCRLFSSIKDQVRIFKKKTIDATMLFYIKNMVLTIITIEDREVYKKLYLYHPKFSFTICYSISIKSQCGHENKTKIALIFNGNECIFEKVFDCTFDDDFSYIFEFFKARNII